MAGSGPAMTEKGLPPSHRLTVSVVSLSYLRKSSSRALVRTTRDLRLEKILDESPDHAVRYCDLRNFQVHFSKLCSLIGDRQRLASNTLNLGNGSVPSPTAEKSECLGMRREYGFRIPPPFDFTTPDPARHAAREKAASQVNFLQCFNRKEYQAAPNQPGTDESNVFGCDNDMAGPIWAMA